MVVASLAIAFYICWDLTLVVLSTTPIAIVVMGFLSSRIESSLLAQSERLQESMSHVVRVLGAIETIKFFNGQSAELSKTRQKFNETRKCYIRYAGLNALALGFAQLCTLGMFVQGFWYGSVLIHSGRKNPGQVMTAFWATLVATQGIAQILPHFATLEKGKIAAMKLRNLCFGSDRQRTVTSAKGKIPRSCKGKIIFNNVSDPQ
jgi:ATP-binding cassette, subfamily B (MDR/TAP), member 1